MTMGLRAIIAQVSLWKNKSLWAVVPPDIENLEADSANIELKIKIPPGHRISIWKGNQV